MLSPSSTRSSVKERRFFTGLERITLHSSGRLALPLSSRTVRLPGGDVAVTDFAESSPDIEAA